MPEQGLSRRTLLAAAGLGATAAALGACGISASTALFAPTDTPNPSPAQTGPYLVNRLILGEELGTQGLAQPVAQSILNTLVYRECINGEDPQVRPPSQVNAAVYYPLYRTTGVRDHRVPTPNPLNLTKGPYPVLLYAHGFRSTDSGNVCKVAAPVNRDFTTIDFILRHVASYGVICVAPNLSWAPGATGDRARDYADNGAFEIRAKVLASYWLYFASELNARLFAQQVDLSRVIFVGHSTGGGAATQAGRNLSRLVSFRSIAYGLIAPIPQSTAEDVRNLLVLGGTQDTLQGADPKDAYSTATSPKTIVTISGANHFGYTDLCDDSNKCQPYGVGDPPGTISRANQQLAGASYLAALVRYRAQNDETALPYLSGEKKVEGLENIGVTVQSQGLGKSTYPGP